jgi:hypothetical protein
VAGDLPAAGCCWSAPVRSRPTWWPAASRLGAHVTVCKPHPPARRPVRRRRRRRRRPGRPAGGAGNGGPGGPGHRGARTRWSTPTCCGGPAGPRGRR